MQVQYESTRKFFGYAWKTYIMVVLDGVDKELQWSSVK